MIYLGKGYVEIFGDFFFGKFASLQGANNTLTGRFGAAFLQSFLKLCLPDILLNYLIFNRFYIVDLLLFG